MPQPVATPGSQQFPLRQIRAVFDVDTVRVYQAFSPEIAEPALAAGRFVPPFSLSRMTWIKPSFLWMMYRCGWATKPGQERVLAVSISRDGFEWALANSCLSHHDPAVYPSHTEWTARKNLTPVRVQWDPERSLRLEPLSHRSLQVGLSGEAACHYVSDWIVDLADVTPLAQEIHCLLAAQELAAATEKLPPERAYPLSDDIKAIIGAD